MIFGNNRSGTELVIGDGCEKIATLEKQHFFNFAQQELQIYRNSMNQYQSRNAFEYYLEDKEDSKGTSKGKSHNQIVFRKLTIENYVYETIMLPIQEIFAQTSLKFLSRYLMSSTPQYCQL